MKYFILNDKNEIKTGLIDGIHKIPENAILVTEEIWKERLNDSSLNCYENGKLIKKDFRTDEEIAKQETQSKINEALQYLASTAWYVERLNDPSSGKEIPEEVLTKRVEARELINELEAELEGVK